LKSGESATVAELRKRAIREELQRPNSGPALALATYLERPADDTLEWLAKAVLTAQRTDTSEWRQHTSAVKSAVLAELRDRPRSEQTLEAKRRIFRENTAKGKEQEA